MFCVVSLSKHPNNILQMKVHHMQSQFDFPVVVCFFCLFHDSNPIRFFRSDKFYGETESENGRYEWSLLCCKIFQYNWLQHPIKHTHLDIKKEIRKKRKTKREKRSTHNNSGRFVVFIIIISISLYFIEYFCLFFTIYFFFHSFCKNS